MDDLAKEYLISFYSKSLLLHGDRPEALRWTPEGQTARYGLLLKIADDISGGKVLDYGCGKGDFYGFLKDRGVPVDYTGFDITADLVNLARAKYPECRFEVFDVEEQALHEDFDYIFVCGVFNNNVEGASDSLKNVVARLFSRARKALAFNALSSFSRKKSIELNYISPGEIIEFVIENLSPYVVLYHGLAPDDLTVFVYKSPPD